jgi:IS5 family transposase
MKQMTLAASTGFEKHNRPTRKAAFLARMETLVPWAEFCALIEPHYPRAGGGRPPIGIERMLRMYLLANWFSLADEACEDALYDIAVFRDFCRIDLGRERVPDLLHGRENRLYGDSAYANQKETLKTIAPNAKDFTNKRAYRNRPLTESDKQTNRRKSSVRSKVEHVFRPLKTLWGFAKARYRGLTKNANRAFAMLALINLNKWGRPLTGQLRAA